MVTESKTGGGWLEQIPRSRASKETKGNHGKGARLKVCLHLAPVSPRGQPEREKGGA